jgi:hypothetical protein
VPVAQKTKYGKFTPQPFAFVGRGQGRGPAGVRFVSAAKEGLGLGA